MASKIMRASVVLKSGVSAGNLKITLGRGVYGLEKSYGVHHFSVV